LRERHAYVQVVVHAQVHVHDYDYDFLLTTLKLDSFDFRPLSGSSRLLRNAPERVFQHSLLKKN
jgi:hypothetical protein